MQAKSTFRKGAELGICLIGITVLILAGCGGGGDTGGGTPPQTYTVSAGIGEVMQFNIYTSNLTYSYSVIETSYAASGISVGQTGTGTLTDSGGGFYAVSASSDGFIHSGKLFPVKDGLLAGHIINSIGGSMRIPVFGVSSPITQLASLAGTYNFQGFACSVSGVANVAGNGACGTNYGTISINTSGNLGKCNGGDAIVASGVHACTTFQTRTLLAVAASPGIFDVIEPGPNHVGWFFAFTAANGEKVAVLDNDDSTTPLYGHAILSTYASAASGVISGTYFKNDNESSERILTISGGAYSNDLGFVGTINYNSPWNGLSTFSVTSGVSTVTGIGMTTGTGAYTHLIDGDPQFFASGLKY